MRRIALILLLLVGVADAKTIFVSKNGSNTSPYDTWAKAMTTITQLNTSMAAGDTAYFGTGTWQGVTIIPPTGGTGADRTVYACSTYSPATRGLSIISGGETVTGWSVHSGSVYKAHWVAGAGNGYYDGGGDPYDQSYTVSQGDSLLYPQSSLANVNAAGEFWHKDAVDSIYAWCYGSVDPSTQTMTASERPAVTLLSESVDHVLFYGLDLRMGKGATVMFRNAGGDGSGADSIFFEHCNLSRASFAASENPAVILIRGGGATPYDTTDGLAGYVRWLTLKSCSLNYAITLPGVAVAHAGTGIIVYDATDITVDSCVFSRLDGDAIEIKNSYSAPGGVGSRITVKNTKFHNIGGAGMNLYTGPHRDSVYGSIFVNCDGDGILVGNSNPDDPDYGDHVFYNNTFYQCNNGFSVRPSEGTTTYADYTGQFKYNIIYDRVASPDINQYAYGRHYEMRNNTDNLVVDIDSNQIHEPSGVFEAYWVAASRNWAYWQALGYDVQGDTTDPGLNTTTFATTSAGTMSQTYGGRTWTRYGAIQPVASCADTLVAPIFESPANGATGQQNSVILDWSDSTDVGTPIAYDLQVDNNSDYSSVTFSSSPTDSRDTVLVALQYSTTYYWRVRGRSDCDTSAWSASRSFVMRAWPLYQDTCLQITEKVNLNMGDTCYCVDSIAYTFAQRDTLIHTNGYDNIRIWGVGTGRRGLIGYSLSDTGSNSTVTDQQTGSVAVHVAGSDNVLIKNLAIVPRTIDDSVRSFVAVNALTVVGINLDNDSIVAGGFSSRAYQQSTTSGGRSFNQLLQNSYFGTVSKGYHRRDALYGATIKLVTSVIQSDRYGGTYQYAYKVRNNRIHTIHTGIGSAGLTVDTSPTPDDTLYPLIFIDSNTITIDTRNDLFMTYDDNDVNNSAGDPYGIGVDGVDRNSRIMGNSISSMASTYYGGDGMLLQHIDATIDSPFVVAYNTMTLQHGAHPRIAEGRQAVVGAYVRNYDANLFVKGLWIHHNSGYLVVDEDAGTTYAGRYGEAIRAGFENGANGNRIENNHFSIVPRDSLTRTGAGALEVSGLTFEQHDSSNSVLDHGTGNNIARYNYWRVPRNPIWLGGTRIGIGADNVHIVGDTCNTLYDGDSTFVRFHQSGTYYSHSINNTLQDMVLQGYANVSDVIKGTVTASADAYGKQLHYLRSITANLKDSSGTNVNGGTMWALNAYGHRFDMPNSNASGNSSDTLQWRFFGYDALPADGYVVADSNAFNNFTFWGKAGSDSISTTATINWTTSQLISLQLTGIFPLPSPMMIFNGMTLKGVTIK